MHSKCRLLFSFTVAVSLVLFLQGPRALAQLTVTQAVFTDVFSGTCGVVDATGPSLVATFACDSGAEGVDVTTDGTRAVVGNCFTSTLKLVNLTISPPTVLSTIPSGVACVQEVDIAPNNSFGIAPGSSDGKVTKFTLTPFAVTGTHPGFGTGGRLGSPQDVHVDGTSTRAIHPMFDNPFLQRTDVTGAAPAALGTVPTTGTHHGISLSEGNNDTILATRLGGGVTVASLSALSVTTTLPTPGAPESVDIKCDGSRAVVETSAGLMWIDMTTSPPSVLSPSFGPARFDGFSTSTVAFTRDGSRLFVGGSATIDVYNATTDPPTLLGSISSRPNVNVATLPCLAMIEVAVDIRPTSCRNPLNTKEQGVLPLAILGTAGFDVTRVDPASVRLEGVPPLHSGLEDVAAPFVPFIGKRNCFDCTTAGPDGFQDLTLKFDAQAVIGAISPPPVGGQCRVLKLTGNLKPAFGGTPIVGEDVVAILGN